MADDLSAPLGRRVARSRRVRVVAVFGGLIAALFAVIAVWALLADDPLGGEPIALSTIVRTVPPAPPKPEAAAASAARPDVAGIQSIETTAEAPKNGPLIIKISPAGTAGPVGAGGTAPAAPVPALLEASKYGSLPHIAADGRRPSDLYARTAAAGDDRRPKVALLIGGLGIGASATADAIQHMPAEISLGFVPYAPEIDRWVERARSGGHEVVLQVPMEPFDYPNNDPGPQTLLTSLPADANVERLKWAMGRATGYVAVGNYMGARFTSTEDAIRPVLTEVARRGLLFVDDGASPRSLVARLGPALGAAVIRADLVIDSVPVAGDVDAALARLEEEARQQGVAVGVGSAQPVTLARVEAWAKDLQQRGIALVPVSAAAKRRGPS